MLKLCQGKIRKRIEKSREIQKKRFIDENIFTNAEMKNSHIKKFCVLTERIERLLKKAALMMQISARSYYKIIKTARTIADLDNSDKIKVSHMAEALQYRPQTEETQI